MRKAKEKREACSTYGVPDSGAHKAEVRGNIWYLKDTKGFAGAKPVLRAAHRVAAVETFVAGAVSYGD